MKRFLTAFLSLLVLVCLTASVFAADDTDKSELLYVIDHAELLTDAEEEELARMAREISQRQQCDVVILTERSIGSKTPREFADDYFDSHGYGAGEQRSGLLLLLSMQERDWYMSTRGEGIDIFTDDKIDEIWDRCGASISNGNYENGFRTFLQACDKAIRNYRNAELVRLVKVTLFSLVIGFLVAFAFTGTLRAQLKSVRAKYNATNYRRENSMQLERNRDIYLYANTTSRVIESNRSSSGGGRSSTHSSSSGATHGGHGGKF